MKYTGGGGVGVVWCQWWCRRCYGRAGGARERRVKRRQSGELSISVVEYSRRYRTLGYVSVSVSG